MNGYRTHIGIFGRCNSGKSTLMNGITGQDTALVSAVAGTTTDPVYKNMEIAGAGPVTLIDTPGYDDSSALGRKRMSKSRDIIDKTDIAIIAIAADNSCQPFPESLLEQEKSLAQEFKARGIPVIPVLTKCDICDRTKDIEDLILSVLGTRPVKTWADSGGRLSGAEALTVRLKESWPGGGTAMTEGVAAAGDTVLLVMLQDSEAPKGRLILPQSRTIQELVSRGCTVICTGDPSMKDALKDLCSPPDLIITDSAFFRTVAGHAPAESRLTSFSILAAKAKGDMAAFTEGAEAIGRLEPGDRILIAEACTHSSDDSDIGRVKIPQMLRERVGKGIVIETVSGDDFPEDLSGYSLIIHCGACMINRRSMLSRIDRARRQGVPVTNYGMAIAWLSGASELHEITTCNGTERQTIH